jgi:hypothetical protein
MAKSPKTALLFAPIQTVAGLIAALLAFGGCFFLYQTIGEPGDTATTYRIFLTPFRPDEVLSNDLGWPLSAVHVVSRMVLTSMLLLMSLFFIQLLLLVRSAGKGDPFSRANARRLGWMGWSLIFAFGICEGGIALLFAKATFDHWALIGIFTLLGAVFLVLSLVFRHGIALREDLEGTV